MASEHTSGVATAVLPLRRTNAGKTIDTVISAPTLPRSHTVATKQLPPRTTPRASHVTVTPSSPAPPPRYPSGEHHYSTPSLSRSLPSVVFSLLHREPPLQLSGVRSPPRVTTVAGDEARSGHHHHLIAAVDPLSGAFSPSLSSRVSLSPTPETSQSFPLSPPKNSPSLSLLLWQRR